MFVAKAGSVLHEILKRKCAFVRKVGSSIMSTNGAHCSQLCMHIAHDVHLGKKEDSRL